QTRFRIQILNSWQRAIKPGMRELEIGCGQGPCTAILAEAVGPDGHVDALDIAPLDYGEPITLADSWRFLRRSKIGGRITFRRRDPIEFLNEREWKEKTWDVAVMCLSMWYLRSHTVLEDILHSLKGRVSRICTAEYNLSAQNPAALPHVMAAMVRGFKESRDETSDENIRMPMSRCLIERIARTAGWEIRSVEAITPDEEVQDGMWEVRMVLADARERLSKMRKHEPLTKEEAVWLSAEEALELLVAQVVGPENDGDDEALRTMDVWAA
ncbi:hypothetical protein NA57DRAFT_17460, partial [Rhizodiscina lignyota]